MPFLLYNFLDLTFYGYNTFSSGPTIMEFIVFMTFIVYYYYEKMNDFNNIASILNTEFILFIGLLIYFAGNFFYMLFARSAVNASASTKNQLQLIYSIITISKNLILSFAFLYNGNTTPKEKHNDEKDFDFLNTNNLT